MWIPLFISATSHLKFAHEHHGAHEGTPAWTKAKPSSSGRSHLKTYRPVQVRIYTTCVELAIFVVKDSVLRPRDRRARRDNTFGSWCQQHTHLSMINPLNNGLIKHTISCIKGNGISVLKSLYDSHEGHTRLLHFIKADHPKSPQGTCCKLHRPWS